MTQCGIDVRVVCVCVVRCVCVRGIEVMMIIDY
jgi:hypothetical protein